ncbi:glycerol kinase GlpK [Rhabdaerophilum sp. SD176]|uniref:glycerol kinase GlpK n=1 Tax=Rhabdaerophilum sp. SD176 TaxID=2983548 RepID=UPI0024E0092A|nr:glycerol kinase GlpK [Rhabdaerophilum sp. SD176]
MSTHFIAMDQGTTSSRALVFTRDFRLVSMDQKEFPQHYPASGWVEHDPEDIWATSLATLRGAVAKAGLSAADIAAIGITNQRETTLIWDRKTGKPIHNAIVWQDRRTSEICSRLRDDGHEGFFSRKTGLLLDPYFSGTKIAWILDKVPGARARAEKGELAFGTVDTFLIWRLTGGKVHATDATNASRTLLYDIQTGNWDAELCQRLDVPMALLPEVRNSADDFGTTAAEWLDGAVAIRGVAGDQQAATIGQACFQPGMMKSTYGTGCFAVMNTGDKPVFSTNRLLTTLAYQIRGQRTYALEGAIFVAGAAVQWLRDGLGIIAASAEAGTLAAEADPAQNVFLVPAFVGLGAPYWDADARGALYGLTRGTTRKELCRAALESVGYQTRDLIEAMRRDWGSPFETVLRVDGGMTASAYAMQFLADILQAPVDRPTIMETTALGAAYLAGLSAGLAPEPADFARLWARDIRFAPAMAAGDADARYAGWKDAIRRTLSV